MKAVASMAVPHHSADQLSWFSEVAISLTYPLIHKDKRMKSLPKPMKRLAEVAVMGHSLNYRKIFGECLFLYVDVTKS